MPALLERRLDGPEVVNGVVTIPLPGPASIAPEELISAGVARAVAPSDRGSTGDRVSTGDLAVGGAVAGAGDFVVGPENRLAAEAMQAFFEGRAAAYSPLVLYGPPGSGKSHLARGLADWWPRQAGSGPLVLTSGTEFARDYAAAINAHQLPVFRQPLLAANLLVLEDLGQLAGKEAAQQELAMTLDHYLAREALVVITARWLPQSLDWLLPALRDRLAPGLSVQVTFPGPAARREIVERLAAARSLTLPKGALQSLASGPSVPVPALHGAIRQLELASHAGTLDTAQLRQMAADRPAQVTQSLREIAVATAKYFGLKMTELKSPSRRRAVVAARGAAIFLARQLTEKSLEQIGAYLGGRDHTTVLHAYRRTEKLLKRDPVTRHAITELRKTLLP